MLICLHIIHFQAELSSCDKEWSKKPKILAVQPIYRKSLLALALGYQSQGLKTRKEFGRRCGMDGCEARSYFPLSSVSFEDLRHFTGVYVLYRSVSWK